MPDTNPLAGRICLITGATRGIGRVAAIALAKQGARVLLVGRDAARLAATAAEVGPGCETYQADLSSMAEVRRLAAEIRAKHDRIHVLINNAGAIFERRETTVDGFEATFALNHLAYFLLTHELRDLLVAAAPARIVNVASRAHEGATLDFDDLMAAKRYDGWKVYARSKLANILFTRALARRLAGTGVTANALHPGFVATGFGHGRFGLYTLALRLMRFMMIDEEAGAATTIHLASSPAVEGVTGAYFSECEEKAPSAAARDDAAAERLWAESERLLGR